MPEPYIALSGDHYLEFINLDGSVGLILKVTETTENNVEDTLTWSITSPNWEVGDLLIQGFGSETGYMTKANLRRKVLDFVRGGGPGEGGGLVPALQ